MSRRRRDVFDIVESDGFFKGVLALWLFWFLVSLAFAAGLVFVAIHFLSKVW